MSVAGILDAMRSSYAPTVRLIWQCLENHANGARWWRMTDEAIADELHLAVDTVRVGIDVLERDRIIRAVRHKRRPTTFTMLRTYPEGCQRPRHEPEIAARFAPALTPEIPETTAELTPEIPETLNPPEKNPPGREEREATAAPPPAPASPVDEIFVEVEEEPPPPEPPTAPRSGGKSRIVVAAPSRRTPLPDDWQPDRETRQAAIEAGIDPDDIREELGDWWLRNPDKPQGDWNAMFRAFVRQAKRQRPAATPSRAAYAATRTGELLASLRAGIAAGAMA